MSMEVVLKSREEKYRGKTLAHLKSLGIREVAQYLPSRSRRTVLRHFELIEKFVREIEEKEVKKKRIRTHLRDLVIVPHLVGKTIAVHSGKTFEDVHVTVEMIGHRLGEFVMTRKRVTHSAAGIGATKSSKTLKK
ncbi:MAG: ribosomal protein S19 family protein [Nanoarchaeota archaeon]